IFGFIMSGLYENLTQKIGAFVVMCISLFPCNLNEDGLFLTFGEFGPGDNIGLMSAKLSATCIRGQFYGIAAAIGKIGAFTGAYAFEDVLLHVGSTNVRSSIASVDQIQLAEILDHSSLDLV